MTAEAFSTAGRGRWALALALAILTFALYWPVGHFEFLNYDDPDYVSANAAVARGLTANGLRWAFTYQAANWHPLTWLSHMLDVQLFGMDPGAHHRVNAGLHALNAVLLLAALTALTRRFWPSCIVAALFAFHPLRVQSVAWIAERKDLLAGTFFFALLLAYARYVRRPSMGRMGGVLVCLALGCMAKPMLVTAPFVLLLLDAWPLGRWKGATRGAPSPAAAAGARSLAPGRDTPSLAPTPDTPSLAPTHPGETLGAGGGFRLVREKIPLFLIIAVSSVLTWHAQRAAGAVGSLEGLGILARLWNAAAGYATYLGASVWPAGLAAFHPHRALTGASTLLPGMMGVAVLIAGSLLAWRSRRCCPAVAVGWAWYVGMLVPVIGLVQVGDQAWAERYTYLPTLGIALATVYPLADLARGRAGLARLLAALALGSVTAFALVTARTLPVWRDSRTLFQHDLEVTTSNWLAHNNLGLVLLAERDLTRAAEHFEAAARFRPPFLQAHYNLGLAREAEARLDDAAAAYERALEIAPGHPLALIRLAGLARARGDASQARALLERATSANPRDAQPWLAQAEAFLVDGDLDRAANCAHSALSIDASLGEAERVLAELAFRAGDLVKSQDRVQRALDLAPDQPNAHALLGRIQMRRGHPLEARQAFERALVLDPSLPAARYDLGTLLLGEASNPGSPPGAAREARTAARAQFQGVLDLRPGDPQALTALAAMALEEGRLDEAIAGFEQALARKPDFPIAWSNLAVAYERQERWSLAIEAYDHAVEGNALLEAARALAWLLATCPDASLCDGPRAVELARLAVQAQGERALEVLAAAQARNGDFAAAVKAQTRVVERAGESQRADAAARLELYRSGRAFTRPR